MSKLYIVGTPIGNLKDISLRALETLKSVDVIAAEDTRVTKKLLSNFDIDNKRLISYHDHNEKNSAKGIISLLNEGKTVALVSDAGMPVVNDPGFILIREVIENNIEYDVIPGPSSVTTALVHSNFDTHFNFHGYLKPKKVQRENQLSVLTKGTHIFLSSPHRIVEELKSVKEVISNPKVFVGREMTKKFQTLYRGDIDKIISDIQSNLKGEFTMVLEIPKRKKVNKYDK